MATERKEILIEMKADMKQLLSQFKRMPGLTAKEARKMVSELTKEFKAANAAAKAAAKTQEQSMRKVQVSAKKAATSLGGLRRNTRELSGSFNAMGEVITEIDPELGSLASRAELAGSSLRVVARTLATGNPLLIAMIGAVVAGVAAYAALTNQTRKTEKRQKELEEALEKTSEELKQQEENARKAATEINNVAGATNQLVLQHQVLSGVLGTTEAEMFKVEHATETMRVKLEELADQEDTAAAEQIVIAQRRLKHINENLNARRQEIGVVKAARGEDEEFNRLINDRIEAEKNLTKRQEERKAAQERNNQQIENQVKQFEETNKAIIKLREQEKQQEEDRKNASQARRRREKEQREEEKRQSALNAKLEAENNRLMEISLSFIEKLKQAKQESSSINLENKRAEISLLDNESERLIATSELEQKIAEDRINAIRAEIDANFAIAETQEQIQRARLIELELEEQIEQVKQGNHTKELARQKAIDKALKREASNRLNQAASIVGFYTQSAEAVSTLIKRASGENKAAAMVAFRISQAAAVADIAMTTARKIMEVAPNPVAMAGIGVLGGLQAAVVLSQSPPEAHMGGIITKGEDTSNVTVLSGEAVLSRRTVDRLGEEGVNQLQRGKMPDNQVVVIQPFKHFDRYVTANQRRGGALTKLNPRKASTGF